MRTPPAGRPRTRAGRQRRGRRVDDHGRLRRTRFFLDRSDIPWLPVSEPAFLLWVLAGLILVWAGIGLVLTLT